MELTVLGGSGYVGSEYVRQFQPTHINFRGDYKTYTPDVLYLISTITNNNVYLDSHVDIDTNLNLLMGVLDNWRTTGKTSVFNFVSSWFVYGYGTNFEEGDHCSPEGFYSITKNCAEELLKCYCKTFGLKYRILRLANVVGGFDPKASAHKNVLQYFIKQLKSDNTIHLIRGGQIYREYIHVEDCAKAIHKVITEGEVNATYNIGNNVPTLMVDAVEMLRTLLRSKSALEYKDGEAKSFSMKAEKLRDLGYKPQYVGNKLWEKVAEDSV